MSEVFMTVIARIENATTHLQLQGALTIYEAAATAQELLPHAQQATTLCVDLSGVTEIDCAGLQLLIALQKENAFVVFTTPSRGVTDVLRATGLGRTLSVEAA
jgi:anti-sigma B factor antagonist